jgi:co-chaperonin GroES (HSP10)
VADIMNCPLAPLPGRIVLADVPPADALPSGLLLPDVAKTASDRAVVLAIGEGVTTVGEGDLVQVRRYDGEWLVIGETKLRLMREEDVLGRWVA